MSTRTLNDPHHHTAPADLDDPRDAKELSAVENADLCTGCVKCCTYISIEVDSPRAAFEYDQWIWALHHNGIELYVERPEKWFLHIETRCRQLNDQGRCSIYGRHPVLCREYDPRACERRYPLADTRAWFRDGYELEDWIARERPAHWKQLMRYRKDTPDAPPRADAHADRAMAPSGFVALASVGMLAAPASSARPAALPRGTARGRRTVR